mgnify:CR=1 FL=1
MSGLNMATKRSFIQAFLDEEAAEDIASKKSTRMELARAKNKRDTIYSNMRKTKQRIKLMFEKLREQEASHEAVNEDIKRLKSLLAEDE